jgi:hypothetical protein
MMAEGLTLEDIKGSYIVLKSHIDQLQRDLVGMLDGFDEQLKERPIGRAQKRALESELSSLRRRSDELVRDVAKLGSAVTAQAALKNATMRFTAGAWPST